MNLEKFKEKNRIYTPKETLVYLINSSNNVLDKNLESLLVSLDEELIVNIDNRNILDKINEEYLNEIENNWDLSVEQVRSYGQVVFKNLYERKKVFEIETIIKEFNYVMKIFSPDEAVEFIELKRIRKNVRDGGIYYSPEQILKRIIEVANKVNDRNLNKLTMILKEDIIQNIGNRTMFKEYSEDKTMNNWGVSPNQATAYGFLIYYHLIFEDKGILEEEIKSMFSYLMKIYSPDNAERFMIMHY